jgi:ribosomal protein S18 acetylase RimI-like enzyme
MLESSRILSSQMFATMIETNLIERSLYFSRSFKGEIHGPNPVWFITGKTMPTDNGIVKAIFDPEEIDTAIEAALVPFKTRNLAMKWWIGPSSAPGDLGHHLQKHGLTHNRDMMGMAMELQQLPEPVSIPGLTLERVRNKETLAQWYDILLAGFPISFDQTYLNALAMTSLGPDTAERHYLARLRGEIVGISTLYLGGGVAGLYNLVTPPRLRGQGLGAAVTIKTFQQVIEQDYHIATLLTTYPNALRLYHRLGFEVYCKIGIYQLSNS